MAHPLTRALVQWTTLVVGVVLAFGTYVAISEHRAEGRARSFCAHVRVGVPTAPLEARGIAAGAEERQSRWIRIPGHTPLLLVTFVAVPMSRHICAVEGDQAVTKVHYSYFD